MKRIFLNTGENKVQKESNKRVDEEVDEKEKSGAPEDSKRQTEKEPRDKIKQNKRILLGKEKIEEYMKRDFIALIAWRPYNFPLTRINGMPALDLDDLDTWLREHEIDLETLSTDYLRRFYDRKREIAEIQSVPDKPRDGIDAIIKATGRPAHIIVNWMTGFGDCPIEKRDGKIYCGSARALRLWMDEKRLVAGNFPYGENIDGRRE